MIKNFLKQFVFIYLLTVIACIAWMGMKGCWLLKVLLYSSKRCIFYGPELDL